MNCPCDECLCLPICRHKHVHQLFRECKLLQRYNPDYYNMQSEDKSKLFYIQKIMKPTHWEFGYIPNSYKNDPHIYYRHSGGPYLIEPND